MISETFRVFVDCFIEWWINRSRDNSNMKSASDESLWRGCDNDFLKLFAEQSPIPTSEMLLPSGKFFRVFFVKSSALFSR